jgi:O-antigen/teichoic acid export membrane protein
MSSENNKRIAKNTLMLYFRMLLTMGVSLFTVRVVLDTLGVVDYGLYNVVGGIVTMFSFLSGTMASASQRFFSFELGRNNIAQLKKTFSMTMTIYVMIAVLILVLAETVGLWFLNHKMTIPLERMDAARWVYQFSILSFMMTMFTIPYNAAIIAHENMKVYAWVSIIEVLLKLLVVYLLLLFSFDKLKLYAVLILGVTTLVTFIYRSYSKKKFEECNFSFYWNLSLFKEIVSYSGWNLFGAMAGIFNNQGVNIVLNIFFGPVVNAARGIAFQVSASVNQFVKNFMTATRPQIIKYYAAGEKDEMLKLVFQSSKFSFMLLFIISMPVLLETEFIFSLWLKKVPDYTILFTRITIITSLVDSLSPSLMTAAQATGKIRLYQIVVGGVMLLNLPISYVFLKLGYPPQTVFYLALVNSVVCLYLRLALLTRMVELPLRSFNISVIIPVLLISVAAYIIPIIFLNNVDAGFLRFIIICSTGMVSSSIAIYIFGLTKNEKLFLINAIKKYKNEHFN